MDDLELIKAFAELEGREIVHPMGTEEVWLDVTSMLDVHEYNPILDLALNCAARDKYGVSITYAGVDIGRCAIEDVVKYAHAHFHLREEIPRAVLLCILESEGKL